MLSLSRAPSRSPPSAGNFGAREPGKRRPLNAGRLRRRDHHLIFVSLSEQSLPPSRRQRIDCRTKNVPPSLAPAKERGALRFAAEVRASTSPVPISCCSTRQKTDPRGGSEKRDEESIVVEGFLALAPTATAPLDLKKKKKLPPLYLLSSSFLCSRKMKQARSSKQNSSFSKKDVAYRLRPL